MLSRQLLRQVCVTISLSPGITLAWVSSLDATTVPRELCLIAAVATLAGAADVPGACPFFSHMVRVRDQSAHAHRGTDTPEHSGMVTSGGGAGCHSPARPER